MKTSTEIYNDIFEKKYTLQDWLDKSKEINDLIEKADKLKKSKNKLDIDEFNKLKDITKKMIYELDDIKKNMNF